MSVNRREFYPQANIGQSIIFPGELVTWSNKDEADNTKINLGIFIKYCQYRCRKYGDIIFQ